ncbi:MAG: alpha/beta fold hydrolase [Rhizobiales bacterium]|nr:alpha/beta fold hydrolase [Hyphomicrobiales bacterium]
MSADAHGVWLPPADWSAAYDNRAAVGQDAVEAFIADIGAKAAAFRDEMTAAGRARLDQPYGERPRQRFDLFLPDAEPIALAVFIHGGYWRTFDRSFWSHLAAGALARGAVVAIPSYTLCPEVRIRDITAEMVRFLDKITADFPLPLHLAGHSAGGHLASVALDRLLGDRVRKVVSISGVHDLRPLLRTSMNQDLRLDMEEAREQSPALKEPPPGTDLTCWVGADELLAFRRQNRLLAEAWGLLGARTEAVEAAGKNHFSVVLDLADPESELVRTLMG